MPEHLGEFEQLILFSLLRLSDDAYGVKVRQQIEERTGRNVSAGAIYTTLERLEARGYVASRFGESTPARGGRRKKYYQLELAGAQALNRSYSALREMAKGQAAKLEELLGGS
jgi:PadR family transcriptional regulator PadR